MAPSPFSGAAAWFAAGLLLLLLAPSASAQAPPVPGNPEANAIGFTVVCPQTFALVPYNGVTYLTCQFNDLTDDSGAAPGATSGVFPAQSHQWKITPSDSSPVNSTGWVIRAGETFFSTNGRDIRPVLFSAQATPSINTPTFTQTFQVNYTVNSPPRTLNQTVRITAQVMRYDFAQMETVDSTKKAGQFDIVRYVLRVENGGVYPDNYHFDAKGPEGFLVSTPPSLYVPPRSTGQVTVSVLTPHDKVYDLGTSAVFFFRATSTTGSGVYTSVGLLDVSGFYIPTYWIPLTLVGLIAAVVVTRGSRERAQMRRLEAGRPRRVQPTPRQSVLLADLKRTDPAAYAERKEKLDAIYLTRRMRYKDEHKAQLARDKEERRQAKLEFAAAKKRRKEEKRAAKKQRELDQKAAKAQSRQDAKASKLQGKEMRVKEKALAKKRKVLEKARAKQAKIDAKQARVDEKVALVAAKAQAKADKQAAREAKAAAKAAKKNGPPPGQ